MIEKKSRRDLMCVGRYAAKVMRNERSEMSITEAKCLQISHNKYASQRDAISHSMGNLMLSHSAGMHNTDKSIAGISKRFHFASLHYIFSAYLPTHIKSLRDFFQSLLNNHRDNLYIISYFWGVRVMRGTSISSMEMPPCWKVSL